MESYFNSEQLIRGAAEQFEAHDLGDPLFRPGLDALVGAIREDARIEPVRVFRTSMQLMMLLAARAKIEEVFRAHPEIENEPLEAPIFISGLLRTGTTLLHNLLAGHPAHRAPKLWEMRSLVRPDPPDAAWEAQAIGESQSLLDLLYEMIPEFAQIHPMEARRPDECSWLFRYNFATLVYAFTYYIPSYVDWLTQCDMEPYYRYYKKLLQLWQWRNPRRRLVVKDPCHLWHLDALLRVFPDANIVLLHRTVYEALPSMASLCFSLQRVESERADPLQMADYCMDMAERGIYGMMRARTIFPQAKIIDLPYRRLVADPAGEVRALCERLGSSSGDAELSEMLRWLAENRQHKAGKHHYTLGQFGFSPAAVKARFLRYQEHFLPDEPLSVPPTA